VGFAVFIVYFDQNDWFSQQARKKELENTKDAISFLQRQVDTLDADYTAIRTSPQALERYAREHYRMKRDTEDLYIVEKK
jgi:cell division protein FtsB